MKRLLTGLLALLLFASPVLAQQTQQLNIYPGDIISLQTSSVSATNTAAATTLYTTVIPMTYFVTGRQPFPGAGGLHLKLFGTITTAQGIGAPGAANLGCNFGGSTATISLVNGASMPPSLVASPMTVDVWLRQQTPGTPFRQVLFGQVLIASSSTTSFAFPATYFASVIGQTAMNAPQTFACTWQWGSAATTNSIIINHGTLSIDS